MEKKKSTGLLLSILGVISLVLITAGVTYAFFSYTKEGTKTNTIQTGTITFRYDETSQQGLAITNALPMSDADGIAKTTRAQDPEVFNFKIESTTPSSATIPYVITARDITDASKTLPADQVKVYLKATGATGTNNTYTGASGSEVVSVFDDLPTTISQANASKFTWFSSAFRTSVGASNDKILFEGEIPNSATVTGANAYTFELGMWLMLANSGMQDYSAYEFVKKSAITSDTTGTSVATLESGSNILTSTEYYRRINLTSTDPEYIVSTDWARIKYRDYTHGLVITDQTSLTAAPSDFEAANEQYYPLSTKQFSIRVNVYAEGSVYTAQNNG